jgi:DNA polymerase-3 subunit epsilon
MGFLDFLFRRRKRPPSVTIPSGPSVAPPPATTQEPGFVVVDVETTGLAPGRDRVLEIAVIRTDPYGRIVDEWMTLLNPEGPVGASHIHGITAADVRGAPRFRDVIGEVNARLAGRAIVAHNAPFDLRFLAAEYARAGLQLPPAPYLCTLEASWIYLPHLTRRRLADCCWACGIPLHEAHTALDDARATAQLLATYLSPHGTPPLPEHTMLPHQAVQVRWPELPVRPVPPVRRPRHRTAPVAAPPGTLWRLLDNLPLATVVDEGAPATSQPYLELLFQALEDGVLTIEEANSLAELAGAYSLTRSQVEATHRAFLLALAHRIVEDGKVTAEERRELTNASTILGVTDTLPQQILDEAQAARNARLAASTRPLPANWRHGEPLHIGDAVAFTGCDPLIRARLEGQAQSAGLRVTGSVSRRTAVLVTDGADPTTTKAVAARRYGTRVVSPEEFAVLVQYVQPARPAEPAPRTPSPRAAHAVTPTRPRSKPSPEEAETRVDPAAVRAWAREHGLAVGVRGRIPAHVLAAYRAHHR